MALKVKHILSNLVTISLSFVCNFIKHIQFSRSVMSDSLQPHESQHARPPCPSPTPRVHPNSCPLSRWCHPTISSSVIPFLSGPQSFPASGSFPMNQLFTSGGQSIGVSASTSVHPKVDYWKIVITESKHIENISLNEMDGEGSLSFWFSTSNYKYVLKYSLFVIPEVFVLFCLFFLWMRRFQRFRTGIDTVSDFLPWLHKGQLDQNKVIAKFLRGEILVKDP